MPDHEHNSNNAQLSPDQDHLGWTSVSDLPPKRPRRRHVILFSALVAVASLVGWHLLTHHQASKVSAQGPQKAASAVAGWLHTDGTSLVDASGNHVILAGVDDARPNYGEGNTPDSCPRHRTWSMSSAADIANMRSMGFNMDRIALSWANLEPVAPTVNPDGTLTHHWNTQYLAALDKEIAELQANHMVAILDMHQGGWSPAFTSFHCEGYGMPSWLYPALSRSVSSVSTAQCQFFSDLAEATVPEKPQEGLAAAWSMLAGSYASDPTVVGADMVNEPNWPGSCTSADLASFYEKIGQAIRTGNTHVLLIYEDKAYSTYNHHAFLLERKPALTNAVYSWHFYPSNWQTGQASLAAHLARARSWNVPLWIGEFDCFGASYNIHVKAPLDPNWQSDLRALMAYFKQNGISWSIWDYNSGGYSVVVPGTTRPKSELITLLQQDMP